MITLFLEHQIDYTLFIYGIGLIILAIASLSLHQSKNQNLPWIWLAGYALLHALSQWMEGLVYSLGNSPIFQAVRVACMTASLVLLFEFGRRSFEKTTLRRISKWTYLPLLLLTGISGVWGLNGVNTTARYLFGVGGGAIVALALGREGKAKKSRWLQVEGGLIWLYTLLDCFTTPPTFAGPGLVINQSTFLAWTGLPVQIVCSVVVTLLAFCHWKFFQSTKPHLAAIDRKRRDTQELHFILSGGMLLALGWAAALYTESLADHSIRTDISNHINLVQASIDAQKFKRMMGLDSDLNLSDFNYLQKKLREYLMSDERIVYMYLMKIQEGRIFFSVDSTPPDNPDYTVPGTPYTDPPLNLYSVFFDGKTRIIGPYYDEYGGYISGFAAIRDELTNEIVGVAGLDIDAGYYIRTLYQYRLGVTLITMLFFLGLVELTLFRQNSWESNVRIATSEKRLAEAQSIARIGSWSASGMDSPMTWSQEVFTIFGLPFERGAPTFAEFKKMIHPEDLSAFNKVIALAYQSQGQFEIEMRILRPDGSVRHIYSRGTARYSQQMEDLILVAISQDITDRKVADLNVRKFSQVIEQSPIPILITDPNGVIEYINPGFSILTGYSLKEAIGQTPRFLNSGEKTQEEYSRLWNTILSGRDWHGTFHNRKKSGELYWESAAIFPILSEQGKITHLVSVKEDITERVLAEEELRRTHEELAQTNRDLEKASQVKSEFLANMSHEIRTPLNAIIGMTGLLLDTQLDEEQHSFAETVRSSGEVLLTLINEILDFSKIEAQKLELETQSFGLRRCVEEALDLIVTKASEKKIELAYLVETDLPPCFIGDVTRLRQILVNLLSNSVKFTEHGEVVIAVSGQLRDDHLYQLHFTVRDTGIGIPADRLWRLFQSFSQVDASTTRKYGGTGLGLAISKRLSELMGGTMWVESNGIPGEGSIFHFTILVPEDREQKETSRQIDLALPEGLRVLIVDDNKTNREILLHYTRAWRMLPTITSSGQEVLELLESGAKFDIAILDLQMPEMDGIRLAHEIQSRLGESAFPLVLLSSLGYREQKNEEAHFAAYLTKPIKPSQLYDSLSVAINQVLKHETGAQRMTFNHPVALFDREMGSHHPLHLLVVEDNSVNQTVALSLLGRIGYRADLASNGLEALDALRRQPYDLIFMDGQMPEMDGVEATSWIRKQWPPEEQPVIVAMTANAMQGDRERYLAAGMDDYISKPIHIEDMIRALQACQPRSEKRVAPAAGAVQPAPEKAPPVEAPPTPASAPITPELDGPLPVDLSVLRGFEEMMGDEGPEMVTNLVRLYLSDSPSLMVLMHTSLGTANFEDLRRAAHTLKGNCNQLGILPLADISQELEKLAKGHSLEGAEVLIEHIEREFTRVTNFLNAAYHLEPGGSGQQSAVSDQLQRGAADPEG